MIRVPHILGVVVVVSVLGCGEPPAAESGGESETETETETETAAELDDETSEHEDESPCDEEPFCDLIGGGDYEGSFCFYEIDCGSGRHGVDCTAESGCVCWIDDVEVGSCDSLYPALCEPIDWVDPNHVNATIVERLNDCCGWAFEF